MPLVSVIVATYHSPDTLREAMGSALAQTMKDLEVLVVGDGCTDATAEVVASVGDDRVTWIGLPVNSGGPSVPRNAGIAAARGRVIAYLGHDDLWFPDHLAVALDLLERSGAAMAATGAAVVHPDGSTYRIGLPAPGREGAEGMTPSSWVHRADLDPALLAWPVGRGWAEDRILLDRWRTAGVSEASIDTVTVIKFTSGDWRLYDPAATRPPLAAWRMAIEADPAEVRTRIVRDAAPRRQATGPGGLARRLADRWGRDRWPVPQALAWRARRRRGLSRRRRPPTG